VCSGNLPAPRSGHPLTHRGHRPGPAQ
jgi:hypothetical protein